MDNGYPSSSSILEYGSVGEYQHWGIYKRKKGEIKFGF
jgi:hypothetical protein